MATFILVTLFSEVDQNQNQKLMICRITCNSVKVCVKVTAFTSLNTHNVNPKITHNLSWSVSFHSSCEKIPHIDENAVENAQQVLWKVDVFLVSLLDL